VTSGPAMEDVLDRVAELLEARIGLRTESTVRARLRRGVGDEAAGRGMDPRRYLAAVLADSSVFEGLLDRITVQETAFFRHPEQFAALVEVILPAIRPPIRFWSAGCANGQEAYSLAMVLAENGLDGSVVATDLSAAALHRTAAARYSGRELAGLGPARVARHLTRSGSEWEMARSLRQRVVVVRHNITDPLPPEVRSCQVVFCRNVLIYISRPYARAFLERVADTVAPAALFLGSAEAIWPVTDRFQAVKIGDAFVHRLRSAAGTPPRTPSGDPARRPGPARPLVPHRPTAVQRRPDGSPRPPGPAAPADETVTTILLARSGQEALRGGDPQAAVVSFRKWTYLAPDDALAQLHLGLALEAGGDGAAAGRAYAVARRLVPQSDPAALERAMEGYAGGELLRLLELKLRGLSR
jgi:chemotaxis methyl-accepting protein methylase